MRRLIDGILSLLDATRSLNFTAPVLLRLYLAPIFWMAGTKKLDTETWLPAESTVQWFGNAEWGLGLPAPELMAYLATYTEIFGAIFLVAGFAVRFIAVPLMITMLVAAVTVHWEFGWQAIVDAGGVLPNANVDEAVQRLDRAKAILDEHGNTAWLTDGGRYSYVLLNNGIEFAATYFLFCLSLFFMGAGKYLSLDYWIRMGWDGRAE